jgi:hypothetical protein
VLRAPNFIEYRTVTEAVIWLALAFVSFPNTSQMFSVLDTGKVTRSRCGLSQIAQICSVSAKPASEKIAHPFSPMLQKS